MVAAAVFILQLVEYLTSALWQHYTYTCTVYISANVFRLTGT